jgi:hypothetical protein
MRLELYLFVAGVTVSQSEFAVFPQLPVRMD